MSRPSLAENADRNSTPLVTCAIALYWARPFVDRIVSNIKAITYPNVEILISDRHCEDDALECLAGCLAGDSRVRFMAARDRLNWVQHYNALLLEGRGRYFRWMPQDDVYPVCGLQEMVDVMQADESVILVYGPVRAFDDNNAFIARRSVLSARPPSGTAWTFDVPVFLYFRNFAGGAFKGLFRRDRVLRHAMTIRPTHNLAASERIWLGGVALLGRFHFMESLQYRKYFYPGSTSRSFVYDSRVTLDAFRISVIYLYLARVGWRRLCAGSLTLMVFTLKKLTSTGAWRRLHGVLPGDERLAGWLRRQP